jgi:hypothetical protein
MIERARSRFHIEGVDFNSCEDTVKLQFADGTFDGIVESRTHLINILGCGFCETGIAQGVSAQMNGWPLGTDRRAVGIG